MILLLIWLFQVPPGLLAGADAVVLEDNRHFVYQDAGRGRLTVSTRILILNRDGREYGTQAIHYNSFVSVRRVSAVLKDVDGREIRRLRSRDIRDFSATDDGTLIDDARVKVAELAHDQYPHMVEFEYELQFSGMLGLPAWTPVRRRASVLSARYQVDVPAGMPIRYAARNLEAEPLVTAGATTTRYEWSVSNQTAPKAEPDGPYWVEVVPIMVVSAESFRISGTTGRLDSWSSLGRWMHDLWHGRDRLPESEAAAVRALVADAPDDREKVRRVYAYLQGQTRYVSIQLGIGGWQTEDVTRTVRTKYGDCKALVNYMMAMLKAVGIPSYPALVNLGDGVDVIPDIPNNRFNHVILFVPLAGDSLFIECTSKEFPLGYLGRSTLGKHALIVRPEGGNLIRLPDHAAERNLQRRTGEIRFDPSGLGVGAFRTRHTGAQQEALRYLKANLPSRELEKAVRDRIAVGRFDLLSYELTVSESDPTVLFDVVLRLPGYASRAGSRLMFQPNVLEPKRSTLPDNPARSQPIRLPYAYADTDSLVFHLPEGFQVEAFPEPVDIETDFGRYRATIRVHETHLVYLRELVYWTDRLPADRYADYSRFVNRVAVADQARVVLQRN